MTGDQTDFTVNFGFGQWNWTRGSWGWADFSGNFLEDIGTVRGWVGFNEDYSKVMAWLDRKMLGDPNPVNGGPTYQQLLNSATDMEVGPVKYAEIPEQYVPRWPVLRHVNPLDIATHVLANYVIDPTLSKIGLSSHIRSWRGPGGIHWGLDRVDGTLIQQLHVDNFDAIYGLNFIGHALFEAGLRDALGPGASSTLYFTYRNYYYNQEVY